MRNEQIAESHVLLHVLQQIQHLGLHRGIQSRYRFIAYQRSGTGDDGPRHSYALPLSSGKLMRIPVDVLRLKSDLHEDLSHLLAILAS